MTTPYVPSADYFAFLTAKIAEAKAAGYDDRSAYEWAREQGRKWIREQEQHDA